MGRAGLAAAEAVAAAADPVAADPSGADAGPSTAAAAPLSYPDPPTAEAVLRQLRAGLQAAGQARPALLQVRGRALNMCELNLAHRAQLEMKAGGALSGHLKLLAMTASQACRHAE